MTTCPKTFWWAKWKLSRLSSFQQFPSSTQHLVSRPGGERLSECVTHNLEIARLEQPWPPIIRVRLHRLGCRGAKWGVGDLVSAIHRPQPRWQNPSPVTQRGRLLVLDGTDTGALVLDFSCGKRFQVLGTRITLTLVKSTLPSKVSPQLAGTQGLGLDEAISRCLETRVKP